MHYTDASASMLPSQPMANKRPAPVATLSPAKQAALIECFNNGGLYKQNGSWRGLPDSVRISGSTVADLGRDGLLVLIINGRCAGSAQLTERGVLFARTLIEAGRAVSRAVV